MAKSKQGKLSNQDNQTTRKLKTVLLTRIPLFGRILKSFFVLIFIIASKIMFSIEEFYFNFKFGYHFTFHFAFQLHLKFHYFYFKLYFLHFLEEIQLFLTFSQIKAQI